MNGVPVADEEFVELVRARLDPVAVPAGLPLNGVYPGGGPRGAETSVLYEGRAPDFVEAYPGLAPHWDDQWMHEAACVDLWVTLRHDDRGLTVTLEHWSLAALAERYGGEQLGGRVRDALPGVGDLAARLDVVAEVLRLAFAQGSRR